MCVKEGVCVCVCVFPKPLTVFVVLKCVLTGKPVWGESGELVCLKPIPCQPTHFWNDDNGSKYHKAYFSAYPGWHSNNLSHCKRTFCVHAYQES